MNILISNDDGYHARGLACLVDHIRQSFDVTVVAPDRNRSGASNSLTLTSPLRVRRDERGFYSVNGTPTDCVHLAITGLLDFEADMVLSGINHGANLGDDVLYSGTVAAAMEGRDLGLPAIAFSLVGDTHYETAGRVALQLVEKLRNRPLPPDTILNVNVPDIPFDELRGIESTRLGNRHKAEAVIAALDPRDQPVYWIGPAGAEQDSGPGTDFHAIREGRVSVTPIKVDLTQHDFVAPLADWLGTELFSE
ncbi:MAG: 5'/3'-nucleotidase SurE [Gammaproteobacteria bacterium]|nr:5'/3'-nucleotidase SurE [Gammaproteobacteria bacterium]